MPSYEEKEEIKENNLLEIEQLTAEIKELEKENEKLRRDNALINRRKFTKENWHLKDEVKKWELKNL